MACLLMRRSDVTVGGGSIAEVRPQAEPVRASKKQNIVIKSEYNKGWVTIVWFGRKDKD